MWSQKRLDTRIKFGGVWAYRPPEFNLLAKQVLQLCSHIPHLKILHQCIVFVKLKIYPILSGSDSSGSDIQGCIVSLTLLDVSTQHAHHHKLVGDDGIEPPQADSKSAALPLCKSPVTKKRACGEV